MESAYKKLLEKQGYKFIGEHSASKICTWTRKSLRNEGFCYKQKFYGIRSHMCAQISVSVNFCQNDCIYCWRERHNSPFEQIDEPKQIIENAIIAQRALISGYGGYAKVNKKKLKEAQNPAHFAISLTGETLAYPKINELITDLKKRNYTSFIVTNGQMPEVLEKLEMPTQLYISLSAPNEELFKEINRPSLKDGWKKLMKSMKILKKLKDKTRTTIRLTMIKNLNMIHPEEYAKIIEMANPTFLEVKAYMFIGASKERLSLENMPYHEEIVAFANELSKHCPYKIIDEQKASRVVLMMKEDRKDRLMKF